MRFLSTRGDVAVRLEQAIMTGTAPDGGLYVPESLPLRTIDEFDGLSDFPSVATRLLEPFFEGSSLEGALGEICTEALDFAVPVTRIEGRGAPLSMLELFHGPTAAFKDVGARFLAACMTRIIAIGRDAQPPVTILVATSGDTGGAVASAFHRKPGTRVVVLFPEGRVSARQQHQLTCWGENVTSLAVRGEFDSCQRLVKAAFLDSDLREQHHLCSANSINVGRLLPQAAYYAKTALDHHRETGEPTNFIVPTGNLGNGLACVWAKHMGMPIDRIVLATNANTTVPDFLSSGEWSPRPSIATLASAMDVGDPSNMERLLELCGGVDRVRDEVSAFAVIDEMIEETIRDENRRSGTAWCPHTATGLHAYRSLPKAARQGRHWVVVATAHAAKFDEIVEPLVGRSVEPPEALAKILEWPARHETIDADLGALAAHL